MDARIAGDILEWNNIKPWFTKELFINQEFRANVDTIKV